MIETAIIYSRTNSKRLKNKAFKKVTKNRNLIERVIENTIKIRSIKKIILATTKSKKDLKFTKYKKKYNIEVFRGSTNDVIDRTISCAKKYHFNFFLRVCGDRPFFDYNHINNLIINLNKKDINKDLITNNKKNKFVDQGLTIEIVSAHSLQKIRSKYKLSKHKIENLTSFYYKNSKKFNIKYLKAPKNWFLKNKYTIDDISDLKRMKDVISKVGYNNFSIKKANQIIKDYDKKIK